MIKCFCAFQGYSVNGFDFNADMLSDMQGESHHGRCKTDQKQTKNSTKRVNHSFFLIILRGGYSQGVQEYPID